MSRSKGNSNAKRANWKKNLVWTMVTMVIMGVLFMAIERKKNATITRVGISIKGIKEGKNLVTKKGIKTMFRNYLGYDLEASSIQDLDLMDMETMLEADERIKKAEVFVDNKDRLYIAILQRVPIVRVFSENKESFYLDDEGVEIPAYKGSSIRVPIASGMIEEYNEKYLESKERSALKDVFMLSKYIHDDEFLSALIEQIDVDENGDITMIPKVGRQKLLFGPVEGIEEMEGRFDKLKTMYEGGMQYVGWRKYDALKLRYDTKSKGKNGNDLNLIFGVKSEG